MTNTPQTSAEERLWDRIQKALDAGGAVYDFDFIDAGYALEKLVNEERKYAVHDFIGKLYEQILASDRVRDPQLLMWMSDLEDRMFPSAE